MTDVIVLGSGRSGTSLVAGLFHGRGYYQGEQLLPPTGANPRGYFEDEEVNNINEQLLASVLPKRLPAPLLKRVPGPVLRSLPVYGTRPGPRQRWLAQLPVSVEIRSTPPLAARMRRQVEYRPFCLKDPRFSYTLPAWRPLFDDRTLFVCVFREPSRTANSIVQDAKTAHYLDNLRVTYDSALGAWCSVYQHILVKHRHQGRWLFLHYDQVLSGDGVRRLEREADVSLNVTSIDKELRRSPATGAEPALAGDIYRQLCQLAGHAAAQTTGG